MRTLSLLVAAPVFVALSVCAGSASADDTTQTDPNLPPITSPTASVPTPTAAAPTTTPPANGAARVVVVQTTNGPQTFQLAPEKKYKNVWYGWQTLTIDGVAITSGIVLAGAGFDDAGWVWIGTYAFGPPIVHALHGRIGIAFADLGVRVGAPVVLGTVGLLAGCGAGGDNIDGVATGCAVGLVVGVLTGYAAAIALDAAVFAREKVEVDPSDEDAKEIRKERARRASTFSIVPDIGVAQKRATLGLHGQF